MTVICFNSTKLVTNVLWATLIVLVIICVWRSIQPIQPYLDYMPDVAFQCPGNSKCHTNPKNRMRMEKNLFKYLRSAIVARS